MLDCAILKWSVILRWLTVVILWTVGSAAYADFLSGEAAYERGDYQQAYEIWLPAAKNGDPPSQAGVGLLFHFGLGVLKDEIEAIKWYQLAVEENDFRALLLLAALYEAQGRYAEAEPLFKRSIVTMEETLDPNHSDLATGLNHLGLLYYVQGKYADAEPLFKRALLIREKTLGPDHPDVARSLNNLGLLYKTLGHYADAEPLYQQALLIWDRIMGKSSLESATALNNLGTLYQVQGLFADAEENFKRSLVISEKFLGIDHPEVATNLSNLGEFYRSQGRYSDAEEVFKKALLIRKKIHGSEHAEVAKILNNLALAYHGQASYTDAELLFKQSLLTIEKVLGTNHPYVSTILNNLAFVYEAQGRYSEAEPLFKRAIVIGEETLGPDHPDVARNINNLGLVYQAQGRYLDAEPLFKRALLIDEKVLGMDHPFIAAIINNLGLVNQAMGRYVEAEPLFKRALLIKEKVLEPDHPDIALGLNNLGLLYELQERYAEAEPLFKRSIVIMEEALGPDHPDVGTVLNNLAFVYGGQELYSKAEPLLKRALLIREKALGPGHPDVAQALNNLALLYDKLDNKKVSLDYIRRAVAIDRARAILFDGLVDVSHSEQKLNQNVFKFHVQLALEIDDPSNHKALISEAFESSQLAITTKAGAALESMANRFAAKNNKIAELVRQRQDTVEQWQNLDQTLVKSFSLTTEERDKVAEAVLTKSLTEKMNLIKGIDQKLETSFPKFVELSSVKPATLNATQTLLGPSEALFTFISYDKATYAFLVLKGDVRAYKVDLSEEQLAVIVTALRDDIDLSNVKSITDIPRFDLDLAHELYSNLLGPAEDMLKGVEHLLIVPTGSMESLPLNMLVTEPPAAEGSDFDRYQAAAWLPKRFSLTQLPSVSSLGALRMFATNAHATGSFKGFGDPVLNGQPGELRGLKIVDIYQGAQADTDKVRGLPELPETSDELRLIAKYLNSTEDDLYLRERASETELKSADLSNIRVLAFATHGLVGGELSGLAEPALVLTPPEKGSDLDDGLLKASEIAQLKLNADMVLLSACNTASGEKLGAEGLSGLARAFIYAGARSLLVSHWSVDSFAAAKLTTGLFEALEADPEMGRAEALQNSMMSLASDDENSHYSHPAFWAPFSLIGEGAALN